MGLFLPALLPINPSHHLETENYFPELSFSPPVNQFDLNESFVFKSHELDLLSTYITTVVLVFHFSIVSPQTPKSEGAGRGGLREDQLHSFTIIINVSYHGVGGDVLTPDLKIRPDWNEHSKASKIFTHPAAQRLPRADENQKDLSELVGAETVEQARDLTCKMWASKLVVGVIWYFIFKKTSFQMKFR